MVSSKKKIKQVCNSCSFYFTAIEESGSPDDAERAFLYLFKEIYGDIPKCNTQGSGYGEEVMEEFERKFNVSREELKKILRGLETM
ncbi:MAG: hypothetical protein QHH29_08080 [bacterium]|nr:hypothetical protein [candidate division WOR-3 bacterium]MDH7519694.1 hypothetical protein [bacterium]